LTGYGLRLARDKSHGILDSRNGSSDPKEMVGVKKKKGGGRQTGYLRRELLETDLLGVENLELPLKQFEERRKVSYVCEIWGFKNGSRERLLKIGRGRKGLNILEPLDRALRRCYDEGRRSSQVYAGSSECANYKRPCVEVLIVF